MFSEFEHGINRYLSGLANTDIRTLADVVAFNESHHDEELAWHNQALLEGSVGSKPLPNPEYRIVLPQSELSRDRTSDARSAAIGSMRSSPRRS